MFAKNFLVIDLAVNQTAVVQSARKEPEKKRVSRFDEPKPLYSQVKEKEIYNKVEQNEVQFEAQNDINAP